MKPHEETWDNDDDFEIVIVGPELDRTKDRLRETLARAAPEMARALLLMVCRDPLCRSENCQRGREALKKAGVLE